ncbi:MAG: TIR domain-containing protein [Anaerolineae bacterium]|nr:TIR domain-containing protein [Anaerolineae bacterium]
MPEPKRPLKVFLCHASTDKPKVRELYRYLKKRGIQPWFDEEDLVGGQDWQVEIPKALATSDAIIICLTKNSIDREGYIQKEIKFALDKALEMPEGRIFLIPVKFEECEVPFTLSRYQWVDLTVESGYARMMKALKFRASQLERSTVEVSKKDVVEENITREKAEKEAAEKARLEAEELARQKTAKDKAEREATERAEKERKVKELREKQAREAGEKTKRETENKEDKPVAVKPKAVNQIVYWFGGFALLVTGIVLLSSLTNSPKTSTPTPTSTNTISSKTPETQMTLTVTPLPTSTAIGSGTEKLIFELDENGKHGIYTVNGDGSELKRFTEGLYNDYIVSLSPDGRKILFSSIRENKRNLYLTDLSGGDVVQITNATGSEWVNYKGWSPDGSKIVYSVNDDLFSVNIDGTGLVKLASNILNADIVTWSQKGDKLLLQQGGFWSGDGEIYVVNIDGTGVINLTNNSKGDWFVGWLPNNEEIIFSSERDGNEELYKVAVDGSGVENITQSAGDDIFGFLSLTNGGLFFSSNRSGNYDVYKMDLKDFSVTPLTSEISDDYFVSLSPDESKFVFKSEQGGDVEVKVANVNVSNSINLTQSLGEDLFVDWMPDGEGILFSSNRNNNIDYFSVDLDGTNLINLTKNPEHDKFISWSPTQEKILFSYEAVSVVERSNQSGTWNVQDEDVVAYVSDINGSNTFIFDIPLVYDGISSVIWSPDGSKVVLTLFKEAATYTPDMFIIDTNSKSIVKIEYASNQIWIP